MLLKEGLEGGKCDKVDLINPVIILTNTHSYIKSH